MNKELISNNRGMITPEVKALYLEKTKRELESKDELRLLPYIRHLFIQNKPVTNINTEELDILKELHNDGLIHFGRKKGCPGYYDANFTSNFYDTVNDILFQNYVKKCTSTDKVVSGGSYNSLTKRAYEKDKKTLDKIEYAVLNGGYIDKVDLTKADIALLDKLESKDLIYFKVRENNEDRFDIGITTELWDAISNELKEVLKNEGAFQWELAEETE